jgi:hypothetical protein
VRSFSVIFTYMDVMYFDHRLLLLFVICLQRSSIFNFLAIFKQVSLWPFHTCIQCASIIFPIYPLFFCFHLPLVLPTPVVPLLCSCPFIKDLDSADETKHAKKEKVIFMEAGIFYYSYLHLHYHTMPSM